MSTGQKGLGRLVRHSGIYALGSALGAIGAFLLLPLYTRYLSVAEYGALEILYASAAVIMGVLSVGISHATLRFYFEYETQSERNAVISTNFVLSFAIALFGLSVVYFWRGEISQLVFGSERYRYALSLLLVSVLFELSSQVCLAYVRAREYSIFFVAVAFGKLLIQVAANSYFVIVEGRGVEGVLLGNLMAVTIGWVVLMGVTLYQCGMAVHLRKVPAILSYSAPFLFSTIVGLVSANIDKFLLNSLLSLQAVGIYALALKFSSALLAFVGEPFNRAYGAYRFSIMKQDNAADIQSTTLRYLMLLTLVLSLVIAFFAKDLLMLMSNMEYWPAADYIPLLLIAAAFTIMTYPLQTGILYHKKTKHIFYISVVSAVTSAAGGFLLIPLFGITGAAVAQILTWLITAMVTGWVARRYFSVDYGIGKLVLLFLAVIFLFAISFSLDGQARALAWPIKLFLLGAFVVVVFFSSFVRPEERARAKSIFRLRVSG